MENENKSCKNRSVVLLIGLSIVVAAFLLGIFAYNGLKKVSMGERVVTVKGKAEIEVKADKASMSISYSLKGNSLSEITAESKTKTALVKEFLTDMGFTNEEILTGSLSMNENDYINAVYRYTGNRRITVRSKRVDKVRELESNLGALYEKGVIIDSYWANANYEISDINSIKPKLITESMQSAKKAGEQFAKDAESKLGKMKTAWQGQIDITNVDETTPYIKVCRVVSTITYYLED